MTYAMPPYRPTVPEVQPLVHALYSTPHGAAGGCLHIVLDDGNIKDTHVEFCIRTAREAGCEQCLDLGLKLLRMSKTQRRKLSAGAYR